MHEEDDELEESEPGGLDLLLRVLAALQEDREEGVGEDVAHELHLVRVGGVGEVALAQLEEERRDVDVGDLWRLLEL